MDPSSVNLVIYHGGCSDGFAGAWAAWKLLGNRAEYVAGVYGHPPPDVKGKNVVCVDFAYDNATTKRLIAESNDFLILDHHKSAMIALYDVSEAIFDMSRSGAIISWQWFHPTVEPPKFLKYVQDKDLWHWKLPYSKEFCASFEMVPFEFDEFDALTDDSVFDEAVKKGSYILAYKRTYVTRIVEKAIACKIAGYTATVVNTPHWISDVGHHMAKISDVAIIWYYDHNDQMTVVSLRSEHDDVDVSEIAKLFGGGGHKQSAGFKLKGFTLDAVIEKV